MKFLIDGQTLSTPEINRGIGVVFKRLCEELILKDISKEWFITVRSIADLAHLSAAVQQRLIPIETGESLNQSSYAEQTRHYSQVLNQVVAEFGIDAYWVLNPLMPNIVLPTDLCNVNIFATIYDLIPLIMPQYYLNKWPENLRAEYIRRIEKLPVWADKLIFISESAKIDFEKIDNLVASKSVAIPLAVDHTKFWSYISPPDTSKSPYVLLTGGFDPRKNMYEALKAFAHLVKRNPQEFANLKFYVVCVYSDEAKQSYEKLAAKLGVSDRLVLTGYVDDNELVALYRGASVFFFPSRYEGFGLPVLEALACGLPVVTTKVSSIPEVIGDLAYYCSPDDYEEMAACLQKALRDRINHKSLKQQSIQRAKEFSWAKTAASYSKLFTATLCNLKTTLDSARKHIAYVSPWIPQRSGIANYSFELVSQLKQYLDITLYLEEQPEYHDDYLGLEVKNIFSLPDNISKYDAVIYHIGNNSKFHKEIYKMAWQYPGIVVLHELNIHPFLADAFLNTSDEYLYADALTEGYGEQGKLSYKAIKSKGLPPEIWKFPMAHALAKRSLATIVHSRWLKEQLSDIDNVFVIPLGATAQHNISVTEQDKLLKQKLGIADNKFLIATFGFVNKFKRLPEILQSIKILLQEGYPVQFLIGGDLLDPTFKLEEQIQSLGIADNVIISGYLNDDDFEGCLRLSDIVLNLRYPSMGESSAALMTALGYGKACIVSNYNQFAELPDSACWKVDIGDMEVPQIVAYLEELMQNSLARRQLGKNAHFFVSNYSAYATSSMLYAYVVHQISS